MSMKIEIIKDNIFKYNNDIVVLAHCISSDYALGQGIAKEVDLRYDMRNKLKELYGLNPDIPSALKVMNIYNLVTKKNYWDKPTYATLLGALNLMKMDMIKNKDYNLIMPKIGTLRDKLKWNMVLSLIHEVFEDTDISIKIIDIR